MSFYVHSLLHLYLTKNLDQQNVYATIVLENFLTADWTFFEFWNKTLIPKSISIFLSDVTYFHVSRGKKCSFFGKLVMLCFLVNFVLKFAFLPYYQRIKVNSIWYCNSMNSTSIYDSVLILQNTGQWKLAFSHILCSSNPIFSEFLAWKLLRYTKIF